MAPPLRLSAAQRRWIDRIHLLRSRSERRSRGTFWIEGIRNLLEADAAGLTFEAVMESRVLLTSPLVRPILDRLADRGVARVGLSPEAFRSVSAAEHASGVGAIVRQRWTSLADVSPADGLGWLAIERLRSPGNLGSILRTAEAFGLAGVLLLGDACDPFDPVTVRSSMTGLFHLKLVRTTVPRLAEWLHRHGVPLTGLSPGAEPAWNGLPRPLVLAIGEERQGLPGALRSLCRQTFGLPMHGRADSLNVAVATGIALFECTRQRALAGKQGAP